MCTQGGASAVLSEDSLIARISIYFLNNFQSYGNAIRRYWHREVGGMSKGFRQINKDKTIVILGKESTFQRENCYLGEII